MNTILKWVLKEICSKNVNKWKWLSIGTLVSENNFLFVYKSFLCHINNYPVLKKDCAMNLMTDVSLVQVCQLEYNLYISCYSINPSLLLYDALMEMLFELALRLLS
jgi:hypothetical protein